MPLTTALKGDRVGASFSRQGEVSEVRSSHFPSTGSWHRIGGSTPGGRPTDDLMCADTALVSNKAFRTEEPQSIAKTDVSDTLMILLAGDRDRAVEERWSEVF